MTNGKITTYYMYHLKKCAQECCRRHQKIELVDTKSEIYLAARGLMNMLGPCLSTLKDIYLYVETPTLWLWEQVATGGCDWCSGRDPPPPQLPLSRGTMCVVVTRFFMTEDIMTQMRATHTHTHISTQAQVLTCSRPHPAVVVMNADEVVRTITWGQ